MPPQGRKGRNRRSPASIQVLVLTMFRKMIDWCVLKKRGGGLRQGASENGSPGSLVPCGSPPYFRYSGVTTFTTLGWRRDCNGRSSVEHLRAGLLSARPCRKQ